MMNKAFFFDEAEYALKAYSEYLKAIKQTKRHFGRYVVLTNHISVENVLSSLIKQLGCSLDIYSTQNVNSGIVIDEELLGIQLLRLQDLDFNKYQDTCFIFLIDTNVYDKVWMECLEGYKNCFYKNSNFLLVGEVIPKLPYIPNGVKGLAEREYSYFIEKCQGGNEFLIDLEKKCREVVKANENVVLLRFDNILSSQGLLFKSFDLDNIIKSALIDHQRIVINNDDFKEVCSFIFAADAAVCILGAILNAKNGHIYNVSKEKKSIGEIKTILHTQFHNKISLEMETINYTDDDINYRVLDSTKFFHQTSLQKYLNKQFDESFYLACSGICNIDYDTSRNLGTYQGKLQRLKEEELEMLEEVKRICQKHDIHFFLTAGSLIGAVRNKKSIPWDDDLDIGMLREDFEKFRKVAPKELNEKYYYSSWTTDSNVHFYFDKIRLKDTYFSTNYSSNFEIIDGVFVDFIIYDQTANTKLFQGIHSFFMQLMCYLIYLKWLDCIPPKHRLAAAVLHPVLKLFSYRFLHKTYDYVARFYHNKKHQKYLLDGGTKKKLGAFPRSYLTEIEWVEFDGVKVPIPAQYDKFLSFFQGENYKELPPISMRNVTHEFGRLDLGKYVFRNDPEESFRKVNLKGELFEEEGIIHHQV